MKRSGASINDIKKRMSRQMDDNLKLNRVTFIINNIIYKELKDKVDIIYNNIMRKILSNS
jgi:dephospho-CoA kinase